MIARDEVKKIVRNVRYLGYIQDLRDDSLQESDYNFDTGGSISEFSYRIFRFLWDSTSLQDDLHFASLQLQFMYGIIYLHPIIFAGRTFSRLLSFVNVCCRLLCKIESLLIDATQTLRLEVYLTRKGNDVGLQNVSEFSVLIID